MANESPRRAALIRLAIVVEGKTEGEFVNEVLAERLRTWTHSHGSVYPMKL